MGKKCQFQKPPPNYKPNKKWFFYHFYPTWMSCWNLGSMVSKWVISPMYKCDILKLNNPLIRSPLIHPPPVRDIQEGISYNPTTREKEARKLSTFLEVWLAAIFSSRQMHKRCRFWFNRKFLVKINCLGGLEYNQFQWDPLPISFPYHSHTSRDSYGSRMGMGFPLLGVPGISLDNLQDDDFPTSPGIFLGAPKRDI